MPPRERAPDEFEVDMHLGAHHRFMREFYKSPSPILPALMAVIEEMKRDMTPGASPSEAQNPGVFSSGAQL